MTVEDHLRRSEQILANRHKESTRKQTEVEIYNSCKNKFLRTEDHINELMEKKKKLEDEISHLQQKQIDRKKFLDEVRLRHQKN